MKTVLRAAALAAATLVAASTASAATWWVGGSALNARSGPGTQYHVLGTFDPCTRVNVVGYSHGWAKIAWNNSHYWVSAKYLRDSACHAHKPKPKKGYGY